jgi:hypothetical protein
MHVVVLHLVLSDHQAHASRRIECCRNVNNPSPFSTLTINLLTDASVPRLRRRRRKRCVAESHTDKYRAKSWTECLTLARIEAYAKAKEYQAQSEHVFQREQLARRDLSWVDRAAWYGALQRSQHVSGSQEDHDACFLPRENTAHPTPTSTNTRPQSLPESAR